MGAQPKFNAQSYRPPPLQDAAALLIEFDGFEQSLEIALSKTIVALALNDFKKDRTDGVLGEDLQQDAGLVAAVDENSAPLELGHGFAMAAHPAIHPLV